MQQIANMIQTETHICKLILNYFSINAPISNYLSFLAIISASKGNDSFICYSQPALKMETHEIILL